MYPLKANKRVSLGHREAAFMLTRIQARAQSGSSLEKREMVGQAAVPRARAWSERRGMFRGSRALRGEARASDRGKRKGHEV